ncbi:serine protease [Marinimicrobium sp. C2-29]|uniref:serine protease n=1 Tax=Marinimicrobium sp. C2-29 TaxID=3139825 RepID=UPI00313A3748
MQQYLTKNTVLTALLVLVALAIVIRIIPPYVPKVVELEISKNKQGIGRIDQSRDIDYSRSLWVDRLELSAKNQLRHPKLGQIGYGNNFFIDIEHEFTVETAGDYRFLIGSDDGFVAAVDGEELCRFNTDRPYRKQTCRVSLEEGSHTFTLSYFQGGGHAGLTVEYRRVGADKPRFFGESSDDIVF